MGGRQVTLKCRSHRTRAIVGTRGEAKAFSRRRRDRRVPALLEPTRPRVREKSLKNFPPESEARHARVAHLRIAVIPIIQRAGSRSLRQIADALNARGISAPTRWPMVHHVGPQRLGTRLNKIACNRPEATPDALIMPRRYSHQHLLNYYFVISSHARPWQLLAVRFQT
jgi:hypothetical protein